MQVNVEIVFVHDQPFSMDVVREAIEILCKVNLETSLEFTNDPVITALNLSEEQIGNIASELHLLAADSLWLEQVSSGSSIFNGRMIGLFWAVLGIVVGGVTMDVLRKTEMYDNATTISAAYVDKYTGVFREKLNQKSAEKGNEDEPTMRIEVEPVADRLRIYVIPGRRKSSIPPLP